MTITTNETKRLAIQAEQIRVKRNNLLASDVDSINAVRWASMSDKKRIEWTEYRNALCDITAQTGFPENVEWPTKPT